MAIRWNGPPTPRRAPSHDALRSAAVVAATGLGSMILDTALGERSLVTLTVHALVVGAALGLLASRDRERAKLAWDATHDALTGLLNRRGLAERTRAMLRMLAPGETVAVVYVDLDHFKRHNDEHGHAVGDRLLIAIARALSATRPTDLVARLGGDELVLVMPRAAERDARTSLARIRGRFERDARALGVEATFSAGVRVVQDPRDLDDVLGEADEAMYAEKRAHHATGLAAPLRGGDRAASNAPRRARRWVSFAAVLALLPAWGVGHAAAQDVMEDRASMIIDKPLPPPPPPPAPVRVELLGGTLAPIDIELAARIVVLDHFILGVAAGLTNYGGVAGQIVDEQGGRGAGSIVSTLALGAFVARAYAGFRPFDGLGLEVLGGYTLLQQSTDVDVGGIAQFLGAQTSATDGHAALTLHAVTAELAWSFYVLDHFVIRPSIGYMQILDADVALSAPGTPSGLGDASTALESAITHYGMTPTVSLTLGYRW